jgi:hypothetical protein
VFIPCRQRNDCLVERQRVRPGSGIDPLGSDPDMYSFGALQAEISL